jgi:hypothetical protein
LQRNKLTDIKGTTGKQLTSSNETEDFAVRLKVISIFVCTSFVLLAGHADSEDVSGTLKGKKKNETSPERTYSNTDRKINRIKTKLKCTCFCSARIRKDLK